MDRRFFVKHFMGGVIASLIPIPFCEGIDSEISTDVIGRITNCRLTQRGFELTVVLEKEYFKLMLQRSEEQIALDMEKIGKRTSKQMSKVLLDKIWEMNELHHVNIEIPKGLLSDMYR